MKYYETKNIIINFLVSLSLISWIFTYLIKIIFISEIIYVNEIVNLIVFTYYSAIDKSFRKFAFKDIFFLFLFIFMEIVFALNDKSVDWVIQIHLQNIIYVIVAFVMGKNMSYFFISKYFLKDHFLRFCSHYAILLLAYFYYTINTHGWNISISLSETELFNYYQGIGRSLSLIIILLLHSYTWNPINWLLSAFGLFFILDYRSVGAGLFVLVFFLYSTIKFIVLKKIKNIIIMLFGFVLIYSLVNYFGLDQFFSRSIEYFNTRIEGKMESESRGYLYSLALSLLSHSFYNLIFGVGISNYNDYLGRLSDGLEYYKHTHNIFLEIFVYFGAFGLVFIFVILRSILINFKYYFTSEDKLLNLLSILHFLFFIQANFGGDFSNNRQFIFSLVTIYSVYPYYSQKVN